MRFFHFASLLLLSFACASPTNHTKTPSETSGELENANATYLTSLPPDLLKKMVSEMEPFDVKQLFSAYPSLKNSLGPKFENFDPLFQACGVQTANALIKQQWSGDYTHEAFITVSPQSSENKESIKQEEVLEFISKLTNWLNTFNPNDHINKIRLHITLHHPEFAEGFLTNNLFYGIDLDIKLKVERGSRLEILDIVFDALKVKDSPIKSLDLEGCFIRDTTGLAEALKNNTSLCELNLRNNIIGPKGAEALADAFEQNPNLPLKYLNLASNHINSEGAIALFGVDSALLSSNYSLEELDLNNNNIGPSGARAIADRLKTNKSLKKLYLRNNNIGNVGADCLNSNLPPELELLVDIT